MAHAALVSPCTSPHYERLLEQMINEELREWITIYRKKVFGAKLDRKEGGSPAIGRGGHYAHASAVSV